MYLLDCKITFSGHQPTQANINIIESMLAKLQGKTPSDSSMSLSLSTGDNYVNGSLRVASISGIFEVSLLGTEVVSVAKALNRLMMTKVNDWSSHRVLA